MRIGCSSWGQLNLHGKPQEKYCQGQAGREDPWISIEQCSLVTIHPRQPVQFTKASLLKTVNYTHQSHLDVQHKLLPTLLLYECEDLLEFHSELTIWAATERPCSPVVAILGPLLFLKDVGKGHGWARFHIFFPFEPVIRPHASPNCKVNAT